MVGDQTQVTTPGTDAGAFCAPGTQWTQAMSRHRPSRRRALPPSARDASPSGTCADVAPSEVTWLERSMIPPVWLLIAPGVDWLSQWSDAREGPNSIVLSGNSTDTLNRGRSSGRVYLTDKSPSGHSAGL